MSGIYEELLAATIQHLEELRARGVKFVSLSRETVAALENADVSKRPAEDRRALPSLR